MEIRPLGTSSSSILGRKVALLQGLTLVVISCEVGEMSDWEGESMGRLGGIYIAVVAGVVFDSVGGFGFFGRCSRTLLCVVVVDCVFWLGCKL